MDPAQGSSQPWGCTEGLGCSQGLPSNFSPVHTAPRWNLCQALSHKSEGEVPARLGEAAGARLGAGPSRALQQVSPAPRTEVLGSCLTGHPRTKSSRSGSRAAHGKARQLQQPWKQVLISVNYSGEEEDNFSFLNKFLIYP